MSVLQHVRATPPIGYTDTSQQPSMLLATTSSTSSSTNIPYRTSQFPLPPTIIISQSSSHLPSSTSTPHQPRASVLFPA